MKPLQDMGRYATVVIDPPWHLGSLWGSDQTNTGLKRNLDYKTMSLPDIKALPVHDVLAEDAVVFCWTVNQHLPNTFGILEAWGIRYAFTMTWVKNGGVQTPATPQFNAEWIVVGKKGSLKWLDTKAFKTANYWPRGAHSAKPEGFYDLLRRVTPAPRLDVFGRRPIGGFDSWGDEAPAVNREPDIYQDVLLD